mgnify:CR=1 FL=1
MDESDRSSRSGFRRGCGRNLRQGQGRGFTLVELLISLTILAVLVALLMPAVRSTMTSSRSFKCQIAQRSVGFNFWVFADESLTGNRGGLDISSNSFTLFNFIDSQYQVGEFWAYPGESQVSMPDASGNDPLRCAEVRGPIVLRPSSAGVNGVSPLQNVSFGFNKRLEVAEVQNASGMWLFRSVRLSSSIVNQQPMTPLMWDVDAPAAVATGRSPLVSAPSLDSSGAFANNRYWFPGMRHGGKGNFAFLDGHVRETSQPLEQRDWRWRYTPPLPPQ